MTKPARLLLASTALAWACLLGACAEAGGKVALVAPPEAMPRLEAALTAEPLPAGWSPAAKGEKAEATIALDGASFLDGANPRGGAGSPDKAHNERRYRAGTLWLAAAVGLADPRFDVAEAAARSIGLEALESIKPPRRALSVGGRWPGEDGYPFSEELFLAIRAAAGAAPRALEAWVERASATLRAADSRPATLCAAGDMQCGAAELPVLASGGRRMPEILRGELPDRLRSADLLVGNLEGPISGRGSPNPRKRFLFRMPPGTARSLRWAGFDLVLFANNHAFDYGPEAFDDTLRELDEASLPCVGAGSDADRALEPRRLESPGGGSFLFLGFASYPEERMGFTTAEAAAGAGRRGVNADEKSTLAAIATASAAGETVVVLAHGGDEYQGSPSPYLRKRYRRFAEAGAALVIGTHPHVLQGIEARGGSLIAYSLGNFLFTGLEEPPLSVRSAAISFLLYRGVARGARLLPVIVDPRGTSIDPDQGGAERRFAAMCGALVGK